MLLNIITGGIGSGKSSYLYKLITENLKNNPGTNAVLVVPEQFSYTAEKTLSKEMGGLGLNRIEVLTFSRLVHRFVRVEDSLLPSGKMMLVAKAVSKIGEDNVFFASAKKRGFINSVSELFSEFRRYDISAEDFDRLVLENDTTSKKLASINEIYKIYSDSISEGFTDSDNALSLFADLAAATDTFKDTFFFIDDYNDFLPQHYDAIRSLIRTSRGVFITLGAENSDEGGFFAPVIKTKKRLTAIALSETAQLYTKELSGTPDYIKANDIRHLLTNWESKQKYQGMCENISLFTARDLYSEIEHTAAEIISLVRDKGFRFRDIGVILGDVPAYLHILNAVFSDFNIPFFTDEKLSVSMHPIARTALALFNIIDENWSYASVFDYLRAGYIYIKEENGVIPLNQEDIDILENYVLMRGIRGKKAWFSEWTESNETIFDDVIENRSRQDIDLEKLNILRRQIILPFQNFLECRGRTVRAIAEAMYGFLCDINLYEGIIADCKQLDSDGLRDESEQFKQIWNSIIEVLDQTVTALGNDVVSREAFADYFRSGLSQCSLAIIPSGLDRVSVGTVQRNSPARVKALFIIGATHGSIPAEPSTSAIFTSLDRSLINSALSNHEKELAPDDLSRIALENMKLYRIISTATERLYISRPASNADGNALSPAHFVTEIINMFPDMKKSDNVISKPSNEELLSSSKRGFYYMLTKLSEYYSETPEKLWSTVYEWYKSQPEYKDKLNILEIAAKYKKIQPELSRQKAYALYGKNKKYSITALEKFSKCPFAFYVERGLYAQPQEEKRIEKSHIGSLIHAAVCEFCKIVEADAASIADIHSRWEALTPYKCNQIIQNVMSAMTDKIMARTVSNKKQIEYLLSRCERTLKKSVETIRLSLSKGEYTAICYEKDFEVAINWKDESVTLTGTIDRIDIMELIAENKANIRIIDYKSGHKEFSISAVCSRLDMQLVLYAVAAVELYKSGSLDKTDNSLTPQVSAIMYNKINDDIVSIAKNNSALAENELKKRRKLDGIVVLDDSEQQGYKAAFDMDKDIEESGNSDFLNISLKKDGSISSNSQVTSRETFDLLTSFMQKTVIDTDKKIKSGNIDISPSRNVAGTACSYCEFSEVCMFDSHFDKCRSIFANDERALEFIKKEVAEDE